MAGAFGVALGVVALLPSLPSELFGGIAPIDKTVRIEPANVAVIDGDTLILKSDAVRLRAVRAPARGVLCRDTAGAVFDCGAAAARVLADLVRDEVLTCQLSARDSQGFMQADCLAGGRDVNRAIVAAGWARVQADKAPPPVDLFSDEQAARLARRGIWADPSAATL